MKLKIVPLTKETESSARKIIYSGLEERFGFLDVSLNADLQEMVHTYSKEGSLFLVGLVDDQVVATGAITKDDHAARIERMSVHQNFRRNNLAKQMIVELEKRAEAMGYKKIVLETNNDWDSAIKFYKASGYQIQSQDEELTHFFKEIE